MGRGHLDRTAEQAGVPGHRRGLRKIRSGHADVHTGMAARVPYEPAASPRGAPGCRRVPRRDPDDNAGFFGRRSRAVSDRSGGELMTHIRTQTAVASSAAIATVDQTARTEGPSNPRRALGRLSRPERIWGRIFIAPPVIGFALKIRPQIRSGRLRRPRALRGLEGPSVRAVWSTVAMAALEATAVWVLLWVMSSHPDSSDPDRDLRPYNHAVSYNYRGSYVDMVVTSKY